MTSWLHNTPAHKALTPLARDHNGLLNVETTFYIWGNLLRCGKEEQDSGSGSSG
jgi:hypothetical protein